jgi:site-specific DNA recombinase
MEHNSNARRCAIYTRKSTTQGLERELNTLDAQRAIPIKYSNTSRPA